jgi:hypothetical protein
VDGMQMLAAAICYRTGSDELVSVEHTLVEVARREGPEGRQWELHFAVPAAPGRETPAPNRVVVLAKHVILALTSNDFETLKLPADVVGLEGLHLAESTRDKVNLRDLLTKVRGQRLFKLFLGYDHVWWNDPRGIEGPSGTANTDLPIRQVYYWGPDKSIDPSVATPYGMLMASYSDSHYVDFWEPMLRPLKPRETEEEKKPYCRIGDLADTDEWLQAYGVSENMVKKAHRQVRMLHPELSMADRIPEPIVALVKDWPNGWHAWRVHARPWLAMKVIKQPLIQDTLFICGEAFSEDQGWVEGALRSTELVLEKLGLAPPDISPEEYHRVGYRTYGNYIGSWPDLDS